MTNSAVNPWVLTVTMFEDQPAELRAMGCLQQVMSQLDDELSETEVKRIAAWFHDKYDLPL